MRKVFLILAIVAAAQIHAALPSGTPLNNPKITGTAGTIESGAVVTNSGTLLGTGVFNFSSGTLTLADGQIPWAKVSKTSSDAAADGSTKGLAAFTAADFNAASGVIALDYANAQAATASLKGFLTAADWSTFNAKAPTASPVFTTQITTPKVVFTGSVQDLHGTGDPEGVVTAAVGSTFRRTDGGTTTTLYVKESGSGNTGWVAAGAGGGGGGSGDVVGPASAVDDRIATFDSTTGKLIQDGGKTLAQIDPIGVHTIYLPAAALTPAYTNGSTSLRLVAGATNQPDLAYVEFSAGTEQYAQLSVAMPKSWNLGTVTVQFIWSHPSTTTNFGVVWAAQGVAISDADTMAANYGTAQTVTDTGATTDVQYISAATSAITIAGTPAAGDTVYFRIYRVAADGADNLAVVARLHGIRLLYTISSPNDT